MSSLGKMKLQGISSVVGDLNKGNTVFGNYHEKFHWVIYEILFMKELKLHRWASYSCTYVGYTLMSYRFSYYIFYNGVQDSDYRHTTV